MLGFWVPGVSIVESKLDFLKLKVGDLNAVSPPYLPAFLGSVLFVEGGACTEDPCFAEVVSGGDCAVISVCPSWVTDRIPTS